MVQAIHLSRVELGAEAAGLAACVILLPIYLGMLRGSLLQFLIYVAVAAAAMAAGERVRYGDFGRMAFAHFHDDWLLYCRLLLAGCLFWLPAYLLA